MEVSQRGPGTGKPPKFITSFYLAPGSRANHCDFHACLSVRSYIAKTTCTIFTKFSVHVSRGPWLGAPLTAMNYYVV